MVMLLSEFESGHPRWLSLLLKAPAWEGGRYNSKRNPRTDLKVGHYKPEKTADRLLVARPVPSQTKTARDSAWARWRSVPRQRSWAPRPWGFPVPRRALAFAV